MIKKNLLLHIFTIVLISNTFSNPIVNNAVVSNPNVGNSVNSNTIYEKVKMLEQKSNQPVPLNMNNTKPINKNRISIFERTSDNIQNNNKSKTVVPSNKIMNIAQKFNTGNITHKIPNSLVNNNGSIKNKIQMFNNKNINNTKQNNNTQQLPINTNAQVKNKIQMFNNKNINSTKKNNNNQQLPINTNAQVKNKIQMFNNKNINNTKQNNNTQQLPINTNAQVKNKIQIFNNKNISSTKQNNNNQQLPVNTGVQIKDKIQMFNNKNINNKQINSYKKRPKLQGNTQSIQDRAKLFAPKNKLQNQNIVSSKKINTNNGFLSQLKSAIGIQKQSINQNNNKQSNSNVLQKPNNTVNIQQHNHQLQNQTINSVNIPTIQQGNNTQQHNQLQKTIINNVNIPTIQQGNTTQQHNQLQKPIINNVNVPVQPSSNIQPPVVINNAMPNNIQNNTKINQKYKNIPEADRFGKPMVLHRKNGEDEVYVNPRKGYYINILDYNNGTSQENNNKQMQQEVSEQRFNIRKNSLQSGLKSIIDAVNSGKVNALAAAEDWNSKIKKSNMAPAYNNLILKTVLNGDKIKNQEFYKNIIKQV